MTRRACATRSPATRAPASCMTTIRTPARTVCSNAPPCWVVSIRATTWNAGCGPPRATANASPSRWYGGVTCRPAIPPCSSPATARTRSAPIRDSRCHASACSTAACCTPCRTSAAAAKWDAPGTSRGTCSTRSIRLRISSTPRARCNAPDWPRRCVRWRTAARRAAY